MDYKANESGRKLCAAGVVAPDGGSAAHVEGCHWDRNGTGIRTGGAGSRIPVASIWATYAKSDAAPGSAGGIPRSVRRFSTDAAALSISISRRSPTAAH